MLGPGDLTDEAYCTSLVETAARELGGLDIVVSNGCRQKQVKDISGLTSEAFDETFTTNGNTLFWIVKEALPHLAPGSSIIDTSSSQA